MHPQAQNRSSASWAWFFYLGWRIIHSDDRLEAAGYATKQPPLYAFPPGEGKYTLDLENVIVEFSKSMRECVY